MTAGFMMPGRCRAPRIQLTDRDGLRSLVLPVQIHSHQAATCVKLLLLAVAPVCPW